jgi:hypothetical protein
MTGPVGEADGGANAPGAPRMIEERPPPGLARGKYAWPGWAIGALGCVVVAFALFFIVSRLKKLVRR